MATLVLKLALAVLALCAMALFLAGAVNMLAYASRRYSPAKLLALSAALFAAEMIIFAIKLEFC